MPGSTRKAVNNQDKQREEHNWLQVATSVLAAGFGVQSEKNRARDFQHGSLTSFIVAGLVATVLLVLLIYGVVKLVTG